MDPHGFGHIYEIFATFTLAYIIIDELNVNPFVYIISEKILKKYDGVNANEAEVNSVINGHKVSLKSIGQLNIPGHEEKIKTDLPKNTYLLNDIDNRSIQFFDRIKKRIRRNYTTRIFVFLNCYLLLYCLSMLFYGGLYEEQEVGSFKLTHHNLKLDNSLFIFFIATIFFLTLGWVKDRQKKTWATEIEIEEDPTDGNNSQEEKFIFDNGYFFTAVYFIGVSIFATFTYYFDWSFGINFGNYFAHQTLIIISVFVPLSNFIIYFIKANRRANNCLPYLTQKAQESKKNFLTELKRIERFIAACDYLNEGDDKIKVTED